MKLKTLKPLYLGGQTLVEGSSFETIEQHGRELIQKGYAELDTSEDEPVVTLDEEAGVSSGVLTSNSVDVSPDTAKPKKTGNTAKKTGD